MRREWFGATIMTSNPDTLMFVDNTRADKLGIPKIKCPHNLLRGPLDVHIALTTACNMACKGCYAEQSSQTKNLSIEHARDIFTALAKLEVFTVAFGGGEPLLNPDIFEIAQAARDIGLVVNMTTNGKAIDNENAKIIKELFSNVHLSWHSRDDEAHLKKAAAILRKNKINYGINILASKPNWAYLPQAFKFAKKNKFKRALVLRYKTTETNQASKEELELSPKMEETYYSTIKNLARKYRIMPLLDCSAFPLLAKAKVKKRDLEFSDVNGCIGGHHCLAVTVDGKYKPCSFWPIDFGHITELTQEKWINSQKLIRFRKSFHSQCDKCDYLELCNGPCRLSDKRLCD